MFKQILTWVCVLAVSGCATQKPSSSPSPRLTPEVSSDPIINKVASVPAPKPGPLLLQSGDRLAICGDSITEQRMYSRIIETYLTACVPELKVTVRQYGWSGERADGFRRRMENDVLRFHPTVATTCYGMNDHQYRPYTPEIGEYYRTNMLSVVRAFKDKGVRVVLGSPGCVGKVPGWVKDAGPTTADMNLNLAELRTIDIAMAAQEGTRFADVFAPMYAANIVAQGVYGTNYAIPGTDGVHPGWAGQTIMAWTFLRSLGLDGDLGTLTLDERRNQAEATGGHEFLAAANGEYTFRSTRYPFCASAGNPASHETLRSGFQWIPFQNDLNRLTLKLKKPRAKQYRVTWGTETQTFTAAELSKGVNLAALFVRNPFSEAFAAVDDAVAKKQAFETKQIKQEFHGTAGKSDMEATVRRTEAERAPLAVAVQQSVKPVTHTIRIVAE